MNEHSLVLKGDNIAKIYSILLVQLAKSVMHSLCVWVCVYTVHDPNKMDD